MNNGEYLNTLTNEEKAIYLTYDFNMWLEANGEILSCERTYTKFLQATHETAADEDFAEIDYYPHDAGVTVGYWYKRPDCRNYVVVYENFTNFDGVFSEYDIDRVRLIADKKRKEMGWDK